MPRPDRPTRPSPLPRSTGEREPEPPRTARPSDRPPQIVLISSGPAIFLAILWPGVAVIQAAPSAPP